MEIQSLKEEAEKPKDGQAIVLSSLMQEDSLYKLIPVTDAMRKLTSETLKESLQQDGLAARLGTVKLLLDAEAHNLKVQIARDHYRRLEAGQPTQIVCSGDAIEAKADDLFNTIRDILEQGSEERVEIKSIVGGNRESIRQLPDREGIRKSREQTVKTD